MPVMFVSVTKCDQKRADCKDHRHCNISCNVCASWENRNKSEQVACPDAKEYRKQVRHNPGVMFFADGCLCNVVTHKENHRLNGILKSAGSFVRIACVSSCDADENE